MLKNIAAFKYDEIIAALPASAEPINCEYELDVKGVSIDSRTIEPENIFIALAGEKTDGHSKIASAFDNGARAAIISKSKFVELPEEVKQKPLISVDDTLQALGALAKFHRKRFSIPVVAIGGSNGKTTTKEMVATVLAKKFKALKTFENFNNQLGVPLMLLQMSNEYNAAALEIGTNEPGEIAILSEMTAPTHGLITNIGKEHLEKLLDLDGVEMEETHLFGYLLKKGGFAFINADDLRLNRYDIALHNKMLYGTDDKAEFKASISFDNLLRPIIKCSYQGRTYEIKMQTTGRASALNAIAAAAVASHFGVEQTEIISVLKDFIPLAGHGYARTAIEILGPFTIINDCYNANPSSMKMAIETLSEFNAKGQKIAILGDMRELGESSEEEHSEIVNLAAKCADFVLLTGAEMLKAALANGSSNISHFESKTALCEYLAKVHADDVVLLVKGSRGMKMEEVIQNLKSRF